MPRPDQDSLRKEIAAAEARLAELDSERTRVQNRLEELRNDLASGESPILELPVLDPGRAPGSKREKVALFRSLFSGRTDVFPKLWRNSRTKKQGYAPACANEWIHGVCEKPRVKCGECPNQAFLEVTG